MQESQDDEEEVQIPAMSSLFFRVLRNLQRYDLEHEIEQQMVDQAMTDSMDSYHGSLFRTNSKLRLNIPSHPLTEQDLARMDENQKRCSLCLETYVPDDAVRNLPCQHMFHSDCIQDAVRHQHASCPICRAPIPTQELSRTPSPKPSSV